MHESKKDIRSLSPNELKKKLEEIGEKKFRATQINEWLWKKSASSFEEMTDLSQSLRAYLSDNFELRKLSISQLQQSNDGTIKTSFKLYDGKLIEGVLIPTPSRQTACISSQVGCTLTCKFCATGKMARLRNLDAAEIFDQVVELNKLSHEKLNKNLSNIVFMGMGEPLLNYSNMLESINKITSPKGLNMSAKRITVSTAGIARMIKRLGDDEVKFNLALSLHAANDEKRSEIMPINEQNSLEVLSKALKYFSHKTKSKVTFEYIIFKDFNDSIQDAAELVKFCSGLSSKVNIIEYNPIGDGLFQKTSEEKTDAFARYLQHKGITVNVRRSRGKDIDAACGQLANKDDATK